MSSVGEALKLLRFVIELIQKGFGHRRGVKGTSWAPGADKVEAGPLAVPWDRLPEGGTADIRGREEIKKRLLYALHRQVGCVVALTGAPGTGKSTLALFLYEAARSWRRHTFVWWVSAVDQQRFIRDMASVARDAGATEDDLGKIMSSAVDAPLRIRRMLDRHKNWVLVLDNLDEPELLGPSLEWLPDLGRGLVVITTRNSDPHVWNAKVDVVPVDTLRKDAAAQVLLDHAPQDPGGRPAAGRLAERLGQLPLGLVVAGRLVSTPFSHWTFDTLRESLDSSHSGDILHSNSLSRRGDHRLVLTRTFELSLDALAAHGLPEARTVLRTLSCLAPATPIPVDGLRTIEPQVLRGLLSLNLIGKVIHRADTGITTEAVAVHPLIADVNRALQHEVGPGLPLDPIAVQGSAVRIVEQALWAFHDTDDLRAGRSQHFQLWTAHLRALLRFPASCFGQEDRARLVATAAHAGELSIDDRDEQTGATLAEAAGQHSETLGSDHPAVLQLRHTCAHSLLQLGQHDKAERLLRGVYDDRVRVLGPYHPDTFETRRWLGWSLTKQCRPGEGEAEFTGILDSMAVTPMSNETQELHVRCMRAWSMSEQGRHREAVAAYEAVIAGRERILGHDHPDTLDARESMAKVILEFDIRRAHAVFLSVTADRERTLGPHHPDTLETKKYLAWTAACLGRPRHAKRRLRQILQVQERILGPDHPYTVDTRERLTHGLPSPRT